MKSAMDSRSDAAGTGAAAPLPLYNAALLTLPDLDRPPAVMEMWELEAVAAALPAKKRRLRETFERLAACSPTPLPFRWEDLDTYISSLQYSATLRRRQLRELEKSMPAPAIAPAAPPAATSLLPAADVGQTLVPEKPRPAPAPVLPVVSAIPAADVDVHELRGRVKPKPVQVQPPAPAAAPDPAAAVPAPAAAAGGVHVEEGRKRKASIPEAEQVHVAKPATHTPAEGQTERRPRKKTTTSPSQDSNGKESMPARPRGDDGDNGRTTAAEANGSTDAAVQVDQPVTKVAAVPQPELPAGPATAATARDATPATIRARAAGVPNSSTGLQRRRPPRPVAPPASAAAEASTAAVVTGSDVEKSRKRKAPPCQEAEAGSQTVQTELAVREVERRDADSVPVVTMNVQSRDAGEAKQSPRRPAGQCTGNGLPIMATTPVDEDPICRVISQAVPPGYEAPDDVEMETVQDPICKAISQAVPPNYNYGAPDVDMETVQLQPEETLPVLQESAPMAATNAPQTQVIIKSEEEPGKVSPPLPLGCSNGHAQAAGAGAATVTPRAPAAAGRATVRKSSPTVTRGCPNLVQASAPAPKIAAGGVPAAKRDVASASHAAARRAPPPAAGSQQNASNDDVRPVPPRGGNGLAQPSRVTAAAAGTLATATGPVPAPARRELSATNHMPASRREHDGPPEASAAPSADKHVLQKQHMPKREPIYSLEKQQERSSKNHGGRPTGYRPVPEAQDAAARRSWSWSRLGEGRDGELAVASGVRGDDSNRNNKDSFKRMHRPPFCDRCGFQGHLAENCRTGKYRVALYQKAKEEREKEQICYRCGCTGHWSRNCRTAKHLVDLYQKDRAAKRAAGLLQE